MNEQGQSQPQADSEGITQQNVLCSYANANNIKAAMRNIITNLYLLIAQTHDYQGANTQQAITEEMYGSRSSAQLIPQDQN